MIDLLARLIVAVLVLCGVSGLCLVAYVVWKDFTMAAEEESRVTRMPPGIRLFVAAALVVSAGLLARSASSFLTFLLVLAAVVGPAWVIVPTAYRRWFAVASVLLVMGGISL
jgi:hypothetical protein